MATSNVAYCTHQDIKDTFPHIDEFDSKTAIYGWEETGTSDLYLARDSGLVTQLFANGEDLGDAEANSGVLDVNGEWYYDSDLDTVYYFNSAASPADLLMESGDDFATLLTRVRKRASRMIDSKIGYRVQDQIQKDREGNYPDVIVRMSSLQTVILLLTSHDPSNDIIVPLKAELDELVEGIISGTIVILGLQRTMDSGKGIIREVSVNANSDLRPVELDGLYSGSGYELLKVYIDTSENGVVGTTRMTVKGKSSTTLKSEVLIDSEIITGDYQSLGVGGMKIRWSGDNDAAITTAADEYEIELFGHGLDSSTPGQVGSLSMTRR